jgi:outer membrane protein
MNGRSLLARSARWATIPVCLLAGLADAQTSTYSLDDLIDRALQHNAQILAGRADVDEARAQLRQARGAFVLPRLRLESIGGLTPDAEGDVFNPPSDTSGVRDLGPFARAELGFVQPLYTFGLLSNLHGAAKAGVEVEQAKLSITRLEVEHQIKELYFGILLAQDLTRLVERLQDELAAWEEDVTLDNPDIPVSAPFKLQLALLELHKRSAQLDDALKFARSTLAWMTGLPEDEAFAIAGNLSATTSVLPPINELYARALRQQPDLRHLKAGLDALQRQEQAARSAYFPQVFLSGGIRYAVAPGRTDQHNPFVKDEFNLFNGGVFVGLRQSFEWNMLGADLDKARAKRRQLEAIETTAAQGIRVEIRRAYDICRQSQQDVVSTRKARNLTREWLQLARHEYELEPGSVKELVSAFEALGGTEEAYYRALHKDNFALADLELAVGGRLSP